MEKLEKEIKNNKEAIQKLDKEKVNLSDIERFILKELYPDIYKLKDEIKNNETTMKNALMQLSHEAKQEVDKKLSKEEFQRGIISLMEKEVFPDMQRLNKEKLSKEEFNQVINELLGKNKK